jgi:hypothetical protein
MFKALVGAAVVIVIGLRSLDVVGAPDILLFNVPQEVTLHEPIVMAVVVDNQTSKAIMVDPGADCVSNLVFELAPALGARQTVRPFLGEGAHSLCGMEVRPGARESHSVVLNQWLGFGEPGLFSLTIRFGGPARNSDGSPLEIARSVTQRIRVLPRDEAVLQTTYERLARTAIVSQRTAEWTLAARALAYAGDVLAVPHLQRVAEANRAPAGAICGIVRIGGPDARRALESLASNPNPLIARPAQAALVAPAVCQ